MKKFLAILLIVTLIFAMAIPSLAAKVDSPNTDNTPTPTPPPSPQTGTLDAGAVILICFGAVVLLGGALLLIKKLAA